MHHYAPYHANKEHFYGDAYVQKPTIGRLSLWDALNNAVVARVVVEETMTDAALVRSGYTE